MIPVVGVVALFQTTQSYNRFPLEEKNNHACSEEFCGSRSTKVQFNDLHVQRAIHEGTHQTLASRSDASAKYDTLHYLLTPRLTGHEGWGGESYSSPPSS